MRVIIPALILVASLAACSGGGGGSAAVAPIPSPVAPSFAPVATPSPAPAPTAFFGSLTQATTDGTMQTIPGTTTTGGWGFTIGVPSIGNGAVCNAWSSGKFGVNQGVSTLTNGFQVVAVQGSLLTGHGSFTGTFWAQCSDGRVSNKYTALVTMP